MAPHKKKTAGKLNSNAAKTADDYLEEGVDLEERGEKWRAGDAIKALRFFSKAIDVYDDGFQKFPRSFDLAYNKAHLQYAITEQPRLLAQLPNPPFELLKVAAESHIIALKLNEGSPDALFNLAQVYTSLAETIIDEQGGDLAERRLEASKFFYESLSCFQRCLKGQEEQFLLTQRPPPSQVLTAANDESHERQSPDENAESQDAQLDSWYSVEEPVTIETLLDTCKAQLETLKALCNVQSTGNGKEVRLIEASYVDSLEPKILKYLQGSEKNTEVLTIRTAFVAALACARFRTSITDLGAFEHDFNQAIGELESSPDLSTDIHELSTVADTHFDFDAAVEEWLLQSAVSREEIESVSRLRWKHITKALDQYTIASKLPKLPNLARVHLSRGDSELLRVRLADEPYNYILASQSRTTLIQNAAVFYGAADRVLSNGIFDPEDTDDKVEATVKLALVAGLQGRFEALLALVSGKSPEVRQKLQSMKEQRLLSQSTWLEIQKILNAASNP